MKTVKRILAVACIICCAVSLLPMQAASAAKSRKKYVALGDSQAAGYGLPGYQGGLFVKPPKDKFTDQWSQIIEIVREKAPEAEIYAANIYNPYVDVQLPVLPLGAYAETYIVELNEAFDMDSEEHTLIDVHSLFAKGDLVNVNVDADHLEQAEFDPHPNKAGHQAIAENFYRAIMTKRASNLPESKIQSAISK